MARKNRQIADCEILAQFDSADAPYVTAVEVAAGLSITRQGAHKRLMRLHQEGRIGRKKTGQAVGWWLTDDDE